MIVHVGENDTDMGKLTAVAKDDDVDIIRLADLVMQPKILVITVHVLICNVSLNEDIH